MLSAISSFLPTNININLPHIGHHDAKGAPLTSPRDVPPNTSVSEGGNPSETSVSSRPDLVQVGPSDDLGTRKKGKPTPLNETFIVVRPPPAKTNHPLNLQLQLVPPSAPRQASGCSTASSVTSRRSMDSIATESQSAPPSPEAIPQPNRSVTDISIFSTNSSASISSISSSSSTVPARRIVPLYNLHAHNVMQNTVLDAGTDAKVAKFSKRGLEVVDLTYLELFELWGSAPGGDGQSSKGLGRRASFLITAEQAAALHSGVLMDEKRLRRASMASFQSSSTRESKGEDAVSVPQSALDAMDTPKRSSTRKFFGRVFKKKEGSDSGLLAPESPSPPTPKTSRDPSETQGVPLTLSPSLDPTAPKPLSTLLSAPVLDLQATLIRSAPDASRATSYIWIVRKWLKKAHSDGLKGMISAAGDRMANLNIPGLAFNNDDPLEDVQLRFEWVRAPKSRPKRGLEGPSLSVRRTPSSTSLRGEGDIPTVLTTPPRKRSPSRASPDGDQESVSNASHENFPGDGDESDPEDSETPWNCTMTVQRLSTQAERQHFHIPRFHSSHSPATSDISLPQSPSHSRLASAPGGQPSGPTSQSPVPTKVKLATLHPAPHHPKIVAQMKVPYPLPDIDIAAGTVHRRKEGKSTIKRDAAHVLSAEEIKDIICATAFWLIVRESFGGVGKERRKGDGWRIRA